MTHPVSPRLPIHNKSCIDLQKEKKNDGRRQKLLPRSVTTSLKLLSPPPKKNYAKLFYLQNGYLYFCSNQTILEIKVVGICPVMGCARFASLYPKSFYCII